MSELQEKIGKLCPSAQIDDSGEFLLITVPDEHWHNLATSLKDELHFDYLTALVGVDWKEELGVMYYLTNTETQEMIHIKVATSDREQPRLHSVSDLWAVANYQEREVFDFYGIEFINHPDMRRFFLRSDWVGYPLRKDYDESPEKNPLRLDDEPAEDEHLVAHAEYLAEYDYHYQRYDELHSDTSVHLRFLPVCIHDYYTIKSFK